MSWYKRALEELLKKEREAKNQELFPKMISKQLSRCRDEWASVPFASSSFYANITDRRIFFQLNRLHLNSNKTLETPPIDISSLSEWSVLLTPALSLTHFHPPPTPTKKRKKNAEYSISFNCEYTLGFFLNPRFLICYSVIISNSCYFPQRTVR